MVGAYIPAYQPKNAPKGYDELRNRSYCWQKEIHDLASSEAKKGLTIVPISVYNKGRKIKVSIAIARGKKKFDKRETIKKRETERDIRRLNHERSSWSSEQFYEGKIVLGEMKG